MKKHFTVLIGALALGALPCYAQQQDETQPPVRAEDPAYLEDPQSTEEYTIDEVEGQNVEEGRAPASEQSSEQGTQSQTDENGGPVFLEEIIEERGAQKTEAEEGKLAKDETQVGAVTIVPSLGGISIEDKLAFTVGTELSFRILEETPLYFEPSFLVSFLTGDNDESTTLFHIDGGFRYDWVISGTPIVPFAKAAIGPTLGSNDNVIVDGEEVSDGYFNAFLGGGLKVLINPSIAGRFDTGITFQGTNPGLYVLGSASLPL